MTKRELKNAVAKSRVDTDVLPDTALELTEGSLSDVVLLRKMEFEMEKLKFELEERERERQFQLQRLQSGVSEAPSPSFDISRNTS
ncbi:hypothetical protein Pmani_011574 [Petrolisthes manimaculis]|uniref:Uncharacterized protein n=1 Tax=Petrolisthes manimaculis TaxID=1843537 RepID=A0AAE1PYY3_9EUCA|nr:hypothetical protein Pmani_011574 [Petrolisthes manimaculis]